MTDIKMDIVTTYTFKQQSLGEPEKRVRVVIYDGEIIGSYEVKGSTGSQKYRSRND